MIRVFTEGTFRDFNEINKSQKGKKCFFLGYLLYPKRYYEVSGLRAYCLQ